ncbi:hypothetical protein JL720_8849 [Aureococcus anophagefferens]|nr:hypothetical protein JL720_8849 [Aureococcus anophagefferens]
MAGSLLLWALSLVALASPAPRPDTVAAALDPPDDDYVGRDLKLISLDVTTYVPEILSAAAGFVSISKKQGGMLDYEKAVVYADDDLSDETYEGDYLYPWTRRVVANASGLDHAFTRIMGVDMDGDGDLDVVAAGLEWEKLAWSYYTDTVAWYEAAPSGSGNGTNWTYHMISDRFPTIGATGVALADMNGDGKLDVLAASLGDRYIVWFDRRLDARAWDIVVVGDGVNGPYDTQPRDFDGDGDTDVVCASANDNRLAWCENLSGDGRFWRLRDHDAALSVHSMYVADIDEDGDLDILSANFADSAVVWCEQCGGDRATRAGAGAPSSRRASTARRPSSASTWTATRI